MLFSKNIVLIAATSVLTTIGYAGSAQAITFNITPGITRSNNVNEGAFSEFYNSPNMVNIDFNNGAPNNGKADFTTNGVSFSFAHNQSGWTQTSGSQTSSVRADMWAPSGPQGENNSSQYLAVFTGDSATVTLGKTLNYFGIDWGAISEDNVFSFYNGNNLVGRFTTNDILPVASNKGVRNAAQGQWNGYVSFFSQGVADNFNKIVISQESLAGGGFESDNFSFNVGTGKFNPNPTSVPEPTAALGLLAIGGILLGKRQSKKPVQS